MHEQSTAAPARADDAALIVPPGANEALPAQELLRPTFSGSGAEYFRIWIVNLMLSVATLGIYSAWAKVRRLQYFDRNTELAGAAFDFHGNPVAILKGRILAVCMLTAYHYAFGFSMAFGITVIAGLLLALPLFMRGALRFRLQNTAYRGLRFGFGGSPRAAYGAYLPPLLVVLLPAALVVIDPSGKLAAFGVLLYLGWPLMHGAMRKYQQSHLQYGGETASFAVPVRRFYPIYLKCIGLALGAVVVTSILIAIVMFTFSVVLKATRTGISPMLPSVAGILVGAAIVYTVYLCSAPYLQTRIANLVWSNTRFQGLAITSTMKVRAFMWLQTKNVTLTLLTLGLYRPFAVVKVYQFRLANATLHAPLGFEHVVAHAARPAGAAGDGVADFFGVDLSW